MNIIVAFLSQPAVILGIFACLGLILQNKKPLDVASGTIKTVVGFLIFNAGCNLVTANLQNLNTLFIEGFSINGVVAMSEAAVAQAEVNFGTTLSLTFIVGFVSNLLFARFTRFKNIIFLTSIQYSFAALLTLVCKGAGLSDTVAIIVGGLVLGFASAFLPELCQPFMRKMSGSDNVAIGHFSMIGYSLAGYLGKLFSKHENETADNLKLPKGLLFFKDLTIGMSVIMLILFYVSALASGQEFVSSLSGSVHWLVWPFIQALTFTASMNILLYGVRTFLAEITASFVAISEKLIPHARPALDCPTVFAYAPTAVMLGFMAAYLGGVVAMFIEIAVDSPVVFIPAANVMFFLGGTAGVFGNSTGGWRGAILGAFVVGILVVTTPLALYPTLNALGVGTAAFGAIDYNVTGTLLHYILNGLKSIFGF